MSFVWNYTAGNSLTGAFAVGQFSGPAGGPGGMEPVSVTCRVYIPLPKMFIRNRHCASDSDVCCDILAAVLKQIREQWRGYPNAKLQINLSLLHSECPVINGGP